MKVLTASEMQEVDRLTTERLGVPSLQLMETAGTRVVEALSREFRDLAERKIVILCGKGNNGGDGFVAVRLLRERGAHPEVLLFAEVASVKGDAAVMLKRWQQSGGAVAVVGSSAQWEEQRTRVAGAGLVIDALLGTGLNGRVEGLLSTVIEDVNRICERTPVVSVDIPSGLPSDGAAAPNLRGGPRVHASITVTFTAPKVGLVLPEHAEYVGRLEVADIGSPAALTDGNPELKLHWLEPGAFRSLPLVRSRTAHKGDYGHALIFAGSRGKTGAAVLAAWGALRAGAGLVTVGTPASVQLAVAAALPEMMTEALQNTDADTISATSLDFERLSSLMQGKNVLAMGPGLGQHPETQQFIRRVVADSTLPVILDADGLNAFAGRAAELRNRKAMLAVTPHPGEMARLRGCTTVEVQARRLDVVREAAAAWQAFVVLKGAGTVVATPDGRAFINSTGNPGMATGGSGDVLTGILAGLTAQFGTEQWDRVLGLGVYLHGLAGDIAALRVGETSLMASDLVGALPEAFHQLLGRLHGG